MTEINYELKRDKINVDVNRLISQTVYESGCDVHENKKGMYVFVAKCPTALVDAAVACKNAIESCTYFETPYKEVFLFLEKVWTKCAKVLTSKQFVSLADELSEKIPKMLKNNVVVKSEYSEDDPFDFDTCYNFMQEFFHSFLELHEGEYYTNSLYYPYSDEPLDKQFLKTFRDYVVFTDEYKDFAFSEVSEGECMYSSMKRLIEELPTGDK